MAECITFIVSLALIELVPYPYEQVIGGLVVSDSRYVEWGFGLVAIVSPFLRLVCKVDFKYD